MRHGHKAYLVGGGVRDLLLGIQPKDYDIATDARPRQIKTIFRNSRIIGRRFKLVHVYFADQKIIEVATFRAQDNDQEVISEEGSEIEAQPLNENIYGTDATDAFRRDLTINGLFYDLSNFSVIDYVGGVEDLRNKIIRVIGDPDKRFAEDPVRLIRTIRHAARTGFSIENETLDSLVKCRNLLNQASEVRIYEELKKDLVSGHSLAIFTLLHTAYLLELMIPELEEDDGAFLKEENHSLEIFRRADLLVKSKDPINTTALLAAMVLFIGLPQIPRSDLINRFSSKHDLGSHIKGCFSKLAVPRKEREKLQLVLFAWYDLVNVNPGTKIQRFKNRDFLPDLLGLFKLISDSDLDHQLISDLEELTDPQHFRPGSHPQEGRPRRGRNRRQGTKIFM